MLITISMEFFTKPANQRSFVLGQQNIKIALKNVQQKKKRQFKMHLDLQRELSTRQGIFAGGHQVKQYFIDRAKIIKWKIKIHFIYNEKNKIYLSTLGLLTILSTKQEQKYTLDLCQRTSAVFRYCNIVGSYITTKTT